LEPIGSGAYKFESFEKKRDGFISSYRFRPNQYFAGATPYIREFYVRFFPDINDAVIAFNKRSVDGLGGLDPVSLENLIIRYELSAINLPRYYGIFFNQSVSNPLKEKPVREALNLAVDKNFLIEKIFGGRAIVINGPIAPGVTGYHPEIYEENAFSLEKSSKLLEDAGWKLNEQGVREKKIGKETFRLEFDLVVPEIRFLIETANQIKENWAAIGASATLIVMNPTDVANDVIRNRNYQMILFGNILNNTPDVLSFWHSAERFYPGLNLALYDNKTIDTALETIRREFDQEKRDKALAQLQTQIKNDVPAIFLFSPKYLYAAPKNFGGLNEQFITTPANRFDKVNEWYLKTSRVFR
jgi:peptide/nickel transport system substrate-binding protein